MVLSANVADHYTSVAVQEQNLEKLQREVDLAERAIRSAAGRQNSTVSFNATIIGNPMDDPRVDSNLTQLQIMFRNAFIGAGYEVSVDGRTGYWYLSWEDTGIESNIALYTVRTTVLPGAVSVQTIEVINGYFSTVVPAVRSKVVLVTAGAGGDITESDFGAINSQFYEYQVIAYQQEKNADYSAAIKSAVMATNLGYTETNVAVYKIA